MSDEQPVTQDPAGTQPDGSVPATGQEQEPAKKHGDPLLEATQGEHGEATGTASSATA